MSNSRDDESAIASGIRRRIDRLTPPSASFTAQPTAKARSLKSSTSRNGGNSVPLGLAFVAVLAIAGALTFRAVTTHQPSPGLNAAPPQSPVETLSTSSSPGSSALVASSQPLPVAIKLPGPVFNLCFDEGRHSLLYAYLSDQPALYEYSILTGKTSKWSLPAGEDSGSFNRVALAPDGAVWVTTNYRIVRVNLDTGQLTTHTFTIADPDANAAALDPNSLSTGSRISAITFDSSGDAIIGRQNVKSLTRLDAALNVVDRIPMPASMVGPADLAYANGTIYVAPANPGIGVLLSEQGASLGTTTQAVSMFGVSGNQVGTLGNSGLGRVTGTGAVSAWGPGHETNTPMDRLVLATDGSAVVFRFNPGVIEWIGSDGRVSGSLTIPGSTVTVIDPVGGKSQQYQQDYVGAIATDATGSVWYTDTTTGQLIHVHL